MPPVDEIACRIPPSSGSDSRSKRSANRPCVSQSRARHRRGVAVRPASNTCLTRGTEECPAMKLILLGTPRRDTRPTTSGCAAADRRPSAVTPGVSQRWQSRAVPIDGLAKPERKSCFEPSQYLCASDCRPRRTDDSPGLSQDAHQFGSPQQNPVHSTASAATSRASALLALRS